MKLGPIAQGMSLFLLHAAMSPEVRRQLPRVFRLLDQSLPNALQQGAAPSVVEELIAHAINQATDGSAVTPDDVRLVAALFNPVKAAVPLSRRPLR